MLSLAALAVLVPDERGFVENIFLKYEKKLYAAALGNETIRANIWNTVASWFSDHIQIGFDDFVETSSVT